MMSLLLSSVSASAIIAAAPSSYTNVVTATLEDSTFSGVNNPASIDLNFTSGGYYLVGMIGQSGGAGPTDSRIDFTSIGGEQFFQHGTLESNNYEEVTFAWVFITIPGIKSITYTHQGNDFNRAIHCWKLSANANPYTSQFGAARFNGGSFGLTIKEGSCTVAMMYGEDGTLSVSPDFVTNTPQTTVETTLRYMTAIRPTLLDETVTITNTSTGMDTNSMVFGAVNIAAFPEFLTVDKQATHVVLGGQPNSATVNRSKTFTVLGGNADGAIVQRAKTFVILE